MRDHSIVMLSAQSLFSIKLEPVAETSCEGRQHVERDEETSMIQSEIPAKDSTDNSGKTTGSSQKSPLSTTRYPRAVGRRRRGQTPSGET